MESWGEDTGLRGVVLGIQLGFVKWGGGGGGGDLRQLEEMKVLGRRISRLEFTCNYTALLKTI